MDTRNPTLAEKETWNAFIAKSDSGHIVQSWQWGEFKESFGNPVTRIAIFSQGKIVAAASYTLHKIPFLNKYVGYLPKGPVFKDNEELYLPELLKSLKAQAKEQSCIFIKIEPNISADIAFIDEIFRKTGLLKSEKTIFAPHSLYLDLTKSDDELLSKMHPKWRYNIRVSERHKVKVQEKKDNASVERFIKLQRETAKRDGFYIHPDNYYRGLWKKLHPDGLVYLLEASAQGRPLAYWLLFKFGTTLYYPYGASSPELRNTMPSHALMWAAIKFGQKIGCTRFDLWGAAAPSAKENDPWSGFTRFKEGFGAQRISYLGAYDLVIDSVSYRLFNTADKLRWAILRTFR